MVNKTIFLILSFSDACLTNAQAKLREENPGNSLLEVLINKGSEILNFMKFLEAH